MCNYYASTLGIHPTVHAFASKAERDEWVDGDWDHRDWDDERTARYWSIRRTGRLMLHGDARVPRSWRKGCVWDYERTEDPDVDLAYLTC